MPAIEFSRSGGNDALSIGGTAFLQRISFMFLKVLVPLLIFLVEYLGILPLIQTQDDPITFSKTEEPIFTEINTRLLPVFKNGMTLNEPYDLHPVDEFMILRLQVNDGNTGPHTDYRIGTIAENSNYSSSVRVSEIIAYNTTLTDAMH